MRKLLLALIVGLAAVTAAACGNSGATTAPGGGDTESLSPIESPSDGTTESEAPMDSVEPSPAAS